MNDSLFTTPEGIKRLETELLSPWVVDQRWFASKTRQLKDLRIVNLKKMNSVFLCALEVSYEGGADEIYAAPLAPRENGTFCDAVNLAEFRSDLFEALFPGQIAPDSKVLQLEQSNTAFLYGDRVFVKLYRRLVEGINPEVEIMRFLAGETTHQSFASFGGSLEWDGASLALATEWVPNQGSAWDLALTQFQKRDNSWFDRAQQLGQRTGEMHLALTGLGSEPLLHEDLSSLWERIENLRGKIELNSTANPLVEKFLKQTSIEPTETIPPEPILKTRTHGDYHLGQVLDTGNDFVIIDFEGEPARPLEERREKHPPIRDIAGMLRSFHYAAFAALKTDPAKSMEEAEAWIKETRISFLKGWKRVIQGTVIESSSEETLLNLYLTEKACYEVLYELNNRPGWVDIPLRVF